MPNDQRQANESSTTPAAIDDEIADHQLAAAERLQAQGVSAADAKTQAESKFGDTTAIRRTCYWIQHGDSLMFRGAVIALLSILCLGLTITAVASWQSQARMALQMTDLTAQLKALAEKPPTVPVPAQPKPLELTGKLCNGSPDTPAAGVEVTIINVKDGSILRRVTSDEQGRFRSGPLDNGDYAVAAPILPHAVNRAHYFQSGPVFVYAGVSPQPVEMDLSYPAGRLAIELSRPLPNQVVADQYTIASRLMIRATSNRASRERPWTTDLPLPETWPVCLVTTKPPASTSSEPLARFYELLSEQDLTKDWSQTVFASEGGLFPEGTASIEAAILLDVIPLKHELLPLPDSLSLGSGPRGFGGNRDASATLQEKFRGAIWQAALARIHVFPGEGPRALTSGSVVSLANDDLVWMSKGLGKLWLAHLQRDGAAPTTPYEPSALSYQVVQRSASNKAPIARGHTTRLRIDVPQDLESRLREYIESNPAADDFAKKTLGERIGALADAEIERGENPFIRHVEATVAGQEPLPEPAAKRPMPPHDNG